MHKKNECGRLIDELKAVTPCHTCGGYFHPAQMDYHHIGTDKSFNISKGRSWAAVEKEISKCWLLCANCHRMIHLTEDQVEEWKKFLSYPKGLLESSRCLQMR